MNGPLGYTKQVREVAIVRILNSNKTKTRPTNDVLKAAFGALNNIKDAFTMLHSFAECKSNNLITTIII